MDLNTSFLSFCQLLLLLKTVRVLLKNTFTLHCPSIFFNQTRFNYIKSYFNRFFTFPFFKNNRGASWFYARLLISQINSQLLFFWITSKGMLVVFLWATGDYGTVGATWRCTSGGRLAGPFRQYRIVGCFAEVKCNCNFPCTVVCCVGGAALKLYFLYNQKETHAVICYF